MEAVLRRFGKTLALVAVLASALNAQCAVSCSLGAFAAVTPTAARGFEQNRSAHACCPGSAKSKPQQHKGSAHQPCSDPLVVIGSAGLDDATHAVSVSHDFDPAFTQARFELALIRRSPSWPTLPGKRGTFHPEVLSSLRI